MRYSAFHQAVNYFVLSILAVFVIVSCQKQTFVPEKNTQTESLVVGLPPPPPVLLAWLRGPDLPLPPVLRAGVPIALEYPQGFAINGKGYIFGGITELVNDETEILNNTWEFDTTSRSWSQKASLPGGYGATRSENFVIGNSAYICNGYGNQNWQYNQSTNSWTRKSDIPFVARAMGTGMSINGKGYIGLGTYQPAGSQTFTDAADWWQYDPTQDTWTRKSEFPGGKREGAAGFTVNGEGYIATGYSLTKGYYTDCWQYDPVADGWIKKADFPGAGRTMGLGLSDIQAGYVTTGENTTTDKLYNDCWQYVPATNAWHSLPQIGGIFGAGRAGGAGFSFGTTLYVGCGLNGIDFWYYPNAR
jgi:N-acetylneuraminic acid mutarotase